MPSQSTQSFFRRSRALSVRQNIRPEIHFSARSSAYGFCDIWVAAARLRGSEEYANDPPLFLLVLRHSLFLSFSWCLCAFLEAHTLTHTLRGRRRLCASLRLLAIRVQKFTLFPEGYCAAADADSLFFLPLSWLPFFPSLPRCLHY